MAIGGVYVCDEKGLGSEISNDRFKKVLCDTSISTFSPRLFEQCLHGVGRKNQIKALFKCFFSLKVMYEKKIPALKEDETLLV